MKRVNNVLPSLFTSSKWRILHFLIANGKEKNNFSHKKINNMHYDNKDAIMMVTIAVDFISSVGHCVYSNICIVHFEYLDHKPAGMI